MITHIKVQQPWLWKFPFRLLKVLGDTVCWLIARFIEVVGLIVVMTMLLGGLQILFIESLAQSFVFHPITARAVLITGIIFAYVFYLVFYLAFYVVFTPSKKFWAFLESIGNKIGESAHSISYAICGLPVIKKWGVKVGGFIGNHKRLISVSAWSVASLGLAGLLYVAWWIPPASGLPTPPNTNAIVVKNPDHALLTFIVPDKALPNGPNGMTPDKQIVVRGAAVIKPLGHGRYSIHFTREHLLQLQQNP